MNEIELKKFALELAIKDRDYLNGNKDLITVAKEILKFLKKSK